jgi:hypothetical protein
MSRVKKVAWNYPKNVREISRTILTRRILIGTYERRNGARTLNPEMAPSAHGAGHDGDGGVVGWWWRWCWRPGMCTMIRVTSCARARAPAAPNICGELSRSGVDFCGRRRCNRGAGRGRVVDAMSRRAGYEAVVDACKLQRRRGGAILQRGCPPLMHALGTAAATQGLALRYVGPTCVRLSLLRGMCVNHAYFTVHYSFTCFHGSP